MEIKNIKDINHDTTLFKLNQSINQNILFNLLYRYNINIDSDTNNIIHKYFNLNDIDKPYDTLFQKYIIYDKNNNLFWITLSLYFISQLDLAEFLYSLFNICNKCEIYNTKFYYNELKNKDKEQLINIIKDFIEISNLHMICFLKFFLHIFI